MSESKPVRVKDALFRSLRNLSETHLYVSFDLIRKTIHKQGITDSIDTLKDYLGEAVGKGILHKAGKGWYSRLSEPAQLDPESAAALVEAVEKAFPLLDFSVWSTTQLNPWMHHLLAQPVHFLNAPADALETVGDSLSDDGWVVAINPPDSAARKAVRPGEKMVVLRPTLSRQPAPLGRQAAIEQVLVDLLVENRSCGLIDDSEALTVVAEIIGANLVQVAGMQRYADSRKLREINSILNPLSSPESAQ